MINRIHNGYSHQVMIEWHNQNKLSKSDLVYPVFVSDGDFSREIKSFPNQKIFTVSDLISEVRFLQQKGLKSLLIFGVLSEDKDLKSQKDNVGSPAALENSPTVMALQKLKKEFPKICLIADVCLCSYTDHGHCGVLDKNGFIDNDESIKRLAEIAVTYAKAGADLIAPSDMMDGRVGKICEALSRERLSDRVGVMSYSAKFASSLYGPFRDACSSAVSSKGNAIPKSRKGYQLPLGDRNLAIKASLRDEAEGASFLIVKPAAFYNDVIIELHKNAKVPIAAYQVSGEYSMLLKGAENGIFSLKEAVMESLISLKRSGASVLITYFAPKLLEWLAEIDK